jgi:tetratricopeptide (TPR) repeat protein
MALLPPALQTALRERGLAFADRDAFERAVAEASRAVEREATPAHCYRYALLLAAQNKYAEALPFLDQAISARPDYIEAITERGLANGSLEYYDRAMVDLMIAIRSDPSYYRAWANRATLHVQRGIWGDAISDASRAIELAPSYALPYKLRGVGYMVNGKVEQALADFRAFLELEPAAPDQAQIKATIEKLERRRAARLGPGWLSRLFRDLQFWKKGG